MKILHIITRMILGGAQENTMLSVFGQMKWDGCEVILLTGPTEGPEGTIVPLLKQHDVTVIEEPSLVREINPIADIFAYYALKKHIKKIKPDVVHTHSSKAGIIGRVAAWHEDVSFVTHTIHGLPFHPYQSIFKNWLYIFVEKYAARHCHRIICVADAMTEQALAAGIGNPDLFLTIYSGMEIAPFLNSDSKRNEVRQRYGFSETDFVITKVARLFELKGHRYLFAAFARITKIYKNAKLFIVGDGIWRDKFEKYARENGFADKVIFAGLVDREKVNEVIAASDMVAHCSLREGLARVLPQALLSAKPVVSFDVDGAREVIIPQKTGYLVKPKDVDGLCKAIIEIIENPKRAKELALFGQQLCKEKFDWYKMVDMLYSLYCEKVTR